MRVLVACEFSATVRDAFRARGHDAWSCDLLPTEGDPEFHIQGDVLEWLEFDAPWDMMIAHPPCTYLANSGVRWLYDKNSGRAAQRWSALEESVQFFEALLNADIPRICIENPIQHKHCQISKPDQIVQPWQFGDNETKAVCLWLKNLPKLEVPVAEKPADVNARVWRMPPGPDRQKERSRFFKGIASAMAEQWGSL